MQLDIALFTSWTRHCCSYWTAAVILPLHFSAYKGSLQIQKASCMKGTVTSKLLFKTKVSHHLHIQVVWARQCSHWSLTECGGVAMQAWSSVQATRISLEKHTLYCKWEPSYHYRIVLDMFIYAAVTSFWIIERTEISPSELERETSLNVLKVASILQLHFIHLWKS